MRLYFGRSGSAYVQMPDKKIYALPPRLDLRNHSPSGFGWGYEGSGPAQLALALLAHALEDDERALLTYQRFKARVIAGLQPDQGWAMSDSVVRRLAYVCELKRVAA